MQFLLKYFENMRKLDSIYGTKNRKWIWKIKVKQKSIEIESMRIKLKFGLSDERLWKKEDFVDWLIK